jgi:DNA sulfur modification protein DndC
MTYKAEKNPSEAYEEFGLEPVVRALIDQVKGLYASDQIPWVIGYSGGKDSTAVVQLVWSALLEMKPEERSKDVHIISTDTLVENPAVSTWVRRSLSLMNAKAKEENLPLRAHLLTPEIKNTFWVNLIGRGYPAPRTKFRWCTERLKIKPTDVFVRNVVKENGEAIVVLGTRKAESGVRAARMKKWEEGRRRDLLSRSTTLQNAEIYSPISEWENDDVWVYLMQFENPWGFDNTELLNMYRGATADGECPLVVDTSTPSCGNSRFGCWVCTLVDEDKSMAAMVQNDEEKEWMKPLLDFRNEELKSIEGGNDHHKRDFRRMAGHVTLYESKDHDGDHRPVPGPYIQSVRADFLRKLLKIQKDLHQHPKAPKEVEDIEIISLEELHEIRRIWVVDKHEIEDLLPEIFEAEMGQGFPKKALDDRQPFDQEDMELLRELCGADHLHFELVRELLDVERSFRSKARRSNLFERIDKAFRKSFYEDAEDATERALRRRDFGSVIEDVKQGQGESDKKALEKGSERIEKASERINELMEQPDVGGAS